MKNFHYSFSDADIKTLVCTLSVMPLVHLDGVSAPQQAINDSCCASAIEKLTAYRTDFHPNEARVMAVSLKLSNLILKDEIIVDTEIKKTLSPYMFSINRLLPIFSSIFD